MTRIWITRPLPETVQAAARKLFDTVDIREATTPLDADELRRALVDYDGVLPTLGDAFSAEVFADVPQPRARILANFGVGYNHIDVAAAKGAGLAVTNTPGAVTDATADIAMMLMLMSVRRAGEGERLVRAGAWAGWHPTQLLGMHLSGKTVGIVGMGRIGDRAALPSRLRHEDPLLQSLREGAGPAGRAGRNAGPRRSWMCWSSRCRAVRQRGI